MRIYGSVQICFWERSDIQQLSDQAKLLAIYLLTGPHSNMLGCLRLPEGYITEDLAWNSQVVRDAFLQLSKINFLTRDEKMLWIVVHDFLKWNPIQNPRQGIGIEKLFYSVPENSLVLQPLASGLIKHGKYLNKGFLDCLMRISKGNETLIQEYVADKDQDQNQDTDKDQDNISPPFFKNNDSYPQEITNQFHDLIQAQALEVLEFLNLKAGRVYRRVEANLQLIMARLNSGASVMDCRQVIAKKTREWKDDPKMSIYLRPETLFNETKFEQYMGELVLPKEAPENESNK